MQISSANLIAAMVLTAFVIERAVAAAAFVLSLFHLSGDENREARAELGRTFWRTLFAGVIAAAVVYKFSWMRLLQTFSVHGYENGDMVLTWLVLVSGTDRLSSFIGSGADKVATAKAKEAALELHGTVEIDSASAKAVNDRASAA